MSMAPFANGTEFMIWYAENCDRCERQGDCDIEAGMIGGQPSLVQIQRSSKPGGLGFWVCAEKLGDIVPPMPVYVLRPLWYRLFMAMRAFSDFWIRPWDRRDYDAYEGLRSPLLAWSVAWGIWHDSRRRV